MALTPLQALELNKRVDRILHAPSNAPAKGQQREISFVLDMTADRAYLDGTLRDAVSALKAHDKIFQNMRSSIVYWSGEGISTKVTPMSFIQMGRAMEAVKAPEEDFCAAGAPVFGELCAYLKLYHARSRCILVFSDNIERSLDSAHAGQAVENLNPFLKHRILVLAPGKMTTGAALLAGLMREAKR